MTNNLHVYTEFDPDPSSIIDPTVIFPEESDFPKIFISCFARTQFDRLKSYLGNAVAFGSSKSANLETPYYRACYKGVEIGLIMAETGAPTCVGMFEEIFARGAETLVLYGNCGVLDPAIKDCAIILPTSAVRDEGTSFHYAPPSREIEVNTKYGALFEDLLKELKIPYHKGKTWTTDAFFRETKETVRRRQEEGCITVEMEVSAMAAMASFRGKNILQFLYAADNLTVPVWDERSLSTNTKIEEKDSIGVLALETACRIAEARQNHCKPS